MGNHLDFAAGGFYDPKNKTYRFEGEIYTTEGMIEMIGTMKINSERMREAVFSNFSTATDLADYLVKNGVPFRKSHEIIGSIVRFCEENNFNFFELSLDNLNKFSPVFKDDIKEIINPENSTERKESAGSTSTIEIKAQIKKIKDILNNK